MTSAEREAAYTAYVTARLPWFRRAAFLLCRDWHRADDLVQTTVTKLYANWSRIGRLDNLDAYARKVLVNSFLAMPFRLGKLPAGWTFQFASWTGDPQGRQVGPGHELPGSSLIVGIGATGLDTGDLQVLATPAVAAFPTSSELKGTGISTPPGQLQPLTVDGHQARLLTDSDHKALIVHDVNGFDVAVEVIGPPGFALVESAGGMVGYYHTISFFGIDRATWTTHVLD